MAVLAPVSGDSESAQVFSGLNFAGREVENLAALIPTTTKLLNKEFNLHTVYLMTSYNIVHLVWSSSHFEDCWKRGEDAIAPLILHIQNVRRT